MPSPHLQKLKQAPLLYPLDPSANGGAIWKVYHGGSPSPRSVPSCPEGGTILLPPLPSYPGNYPPPSLTLITTLLPPPLPW